MLLYSPTLSKKRQPSDVNEYEETPQEKKLRLAKLYLDQLKDEGLCFFSTFWVKIAVEHSIVFSACLCLLGNLLSSEENKADDTFETDPIAGRLQDDVVRKSLLTRF